jgi:hypothetical protein
MFHDLDTTIENILKDGKAPAELLGAGLSFETPDKSFKPQNPDSAVNLFLYEVKENRNLRNPGPVMEPVAGGFERRLPPLRVDCSYLVTAWKDAVIDKIKDEHQLLGQAFFWLSRFPTIPPSYFSGSMVGQPFPPPTMVAQWDGAKNTGEFWNALGIPPRPYFTLIVTIAMDLEQLSHEYLVTSTITSYRQGPGVSTPEERYQIGGQVCDSGMNPAPGAWVRLETATGEPLQTTETNELGRFTFSDLRAGRYQLRTRVAGLGEKKRPDVDVPSSTGEYDLIFP